MESHWLRVLFFCVIATSLLTPSHSKVAAPRKSIENIVRGEEAKDGRYPYTCAIYTDETFACTGVLVHPKIVITAAHCGTNGTQCTVACGGTKRDASDAKGIYLGRFVTNTGFAYGPRYSNVAMVHVQTGEYSNLPLPIVSRDPSQMWQGRLATAIGYGETNEGTSSSTGKLRMARDIIPMDVFCSYSRPTLCGTSTSGRVAHGDLGGPLVIEGESVETDVLFGITSAGKAEHGFHIMYFTNLPYYLDSFISPYIRGIEKDMHGDSRECPSRPEQVVTGAITATQSGCSVTFIVKNSAQNDRASVRWADVTRQGSKVDFDIIIDRFRSDKRTAAGFRLNVYEDISLYIQGDGRTAMWKHNGRPAAYSFITPGSGSHKVRIENTSAGFIVYEDGLKSAVVDILFPRKTVAAQFYTIAERAGLSYTMIITSIRMTTASSGYSTETHAHNEMKQAATIVSS